MRKRQSECPPVLPETPRRPEVVEVLDTSAYTVVRDWSAYDHAMKMCARGAYQRSILKGEHNLSGSSLKGKASLYGGHYAHSRRALLQRLDAHNVPWYEAQGNRGLRVLVIGEPPTVEEVAV